MSFATKYNRGKKFDIDTKGFEYVSLKELWEVCGEGTVIPLTAIYINRKGKFGKSPVFATDNCLVNIPTHMVDMCEEILSEPVNIKEINEGKVGFTIYEYHSDEYNTDFYSINFVDR